MASAGKTIWTTQNWSSRLRRFSFEKKSTRIDN